MTGVCLFVCVVWSGFDSTSSVFLGAEPARRQGATAGLPKKQNRVPISRGRDCVDTIPADVCSSPTSCRLCLLGPEVWSSVASSTSIHKLKVRQNIALKTGTGYTQDTNIQHLHNKTLILHIHQHLKHASQFKQKTQHPSHPLYKHTTYFTTPRTS